MDNKNKFTWLHISDLHVGQNHHNWLWPTIKHEIYADFQKLHSKTGNWDVVIFSGDLTQKGDIQEFENLSIILKEMWEEFRKLGFAPKLFTVPGNHDLMRPSEFESETFSLKQYWTVKNIREAIWEGKNPNFLNKLNSYFLNYQNWKTSIASVIPILETTDGKLIGDQAIAIEINNIKVGIVGLNSTWLQIDSDDYEGKLAIDPVQLLSITDGDPTSWCNQNDINLLVTHHPHSWLHDTNKKLFLSEINLSSRFDLHLFGHMHIPNSMSISQAGGVSKNYLQSASLFGLETFGNSKKRIHGYSINQVSKEEKNSVLTVWPRIQQEKYSGEIKIGADTHFDLIDDAYWNLQLNTRQTNVTTIDAEKSKTIDINYSEINSNKELLEKIKYLIPAAHEHKVVRGIEQKAAKEHLQKEQAIWIISEWAMAVDEFIWTVKEILGEEKHQVYSLDFSNFTIRADYFDHFLEQYNCSFQQFLRIFSSEQNSYLIFDDIPLIGSTSSNEKMELDIEDLTGTILQFCPNLKVILKSRRKPYGTSFQVIELSTFDEAETKAYINSHELGAKSYVEMDNISEIFANTDGVPSRIDAVLKKLQVTSLAQISKSNIDVTGKARNSEAVPDALIKTIEELNTSSLKNSYELLKALSIFPRGEAFDRVRRFNGVKAFYDVDATELIDRRLVDSVLQINMGISSKDPIKTLVVKRQVREYINSTMSKTEFSKLNGRALSLFFGDKWPLKTIKPQSSFRFDHPHRTTREISNASIAIHRLMNAAVDSNSNDKMNVAIALAIHFSTALLKGSHYRSCVAFIKEFIILIPEGNFEDSLYELKADLGQCLRMVSKLTESKKVLMEIKDRPTSKSKKQSLLLDLALSCKSLKENAEAVQFANEIKKIDSKTSEAIHAQSIIIELSEVSEEEKQASLLQWELHAKKKKSMTVANNMALIRARGISDPFKQKALLLEILKNSKAAHSTYMTARTIVEIGMLAKNTTEKLTKAEESQLIESYHYLYNQRLSSIFNRCHESVWSLFVQDNDASNLIRLFRQSSLIWRLAGRDDLENSYVNRLKEFLASQQYIADQSLNKEYQYYLFRVGQNMSAN